MKYFLILLLLLASASLRLHSQSAEGDIFIISSRVHLHFQESQLQGPQRYVAVGFRGYEKDIRELAASFDRYILHDQDMIIKVEELPVNEELQPYRFYLSDLSDANDFQLMLCLHGFREFYFNGKETPVAEFSRNIYTLEKERHKQKEAEK